LSFAVAAQAAMAAKTVATIHEAGAGRKRRAPVAISKDKPVVI